MDFLERNRLTALIRDDMKVSLGVTEPAAIALAVSKARSLTNGEILEVSLSVNSGIYKNAFTCGIPNTEETGNLFAAALGAVAGDHTKGLSVLDHVTPNDIEAARRMIEENRVKIGLSAVSSELYVKAAVKTETGTAEAEIRDTHTNIAKVTQNGRVLFEQTEKESGETEAENIRDYSLKDFWDYADTADIDEIEFIDAAYKVNLALMEEGLRSGRTPICKEFMRQNGNMVFSKNELGTAHVLTAAAIEARVCGLDKPAMSITGSGAHGIICTMPLYACFKVHGFSREQLLRATALSYLITMYIKQYSGRLSAFCGCAIAAGAGMAAALLYLRGGAFSQLGYLMNNLASGMTGMICDGGNPGCVLKAMIAIDTAHRSVDLAAHNICIESKHGINARTTEKTLQNIGLIACPGMNETEKTILDILKSKQVQ